MHVCMCSTGFDSVLPQAMGAIDTYLYDLSSTLSKSHLVDVYGRGKGQIRENNLRIHAFPYKIPFFESGRLRELSYSLLFNIDLIKNISKLHRQNPVDILHVNTVYTTPTAKFFKSISNICTVCSFHNTSQMSFFADSCDKVLANSNYMRKFLIEERKFAAKKVEVLPIAVDINSFKPDKKAKTTLRINDRDVILFVGRKVKYKGPQVLIDALPAIIRSHPKTLAIFLGPDFAFNRSTNIFSSFLLKKATDNNVLKNIRLEGYVPEGILKLYFNAADVVVVPSIWQEPFGKVVIEAFACEKPVIASNVGALPELVENQINGLIVPPNDAESLGKAVIHLFSDKKKSKKMGISNREIVEKKYSFEIIARKCSEIYQEVLQKSN